MIEGVSLIKKLLERGFNITPEALELIKGIPSDQLDSLLDSIGQKPVLEYSDIIGFLRDIKEEKSQSVEEVEKKPVYPEDFELVKVPEKLGVRGAADEFIELVRKRFEFLRDIVLGKTGMDPIPISNLKASTRRNGDRVLIVGMVLEKRHMKDFSVRLTVDDDTGSIPVVFRKGSRYWERADRIPADSVIAIRGTYINGRIYAESFLLPDIGGDLEMPGSTTGKIVFISDIHIGSKYFNESVFTKFLKWLRSDYARDVRYLVIGGDLVDGVGIYPNQEDELEIADVYKQFELGAHFIEMIPRDINIIYIPGNHEPVRQAEPQPQLSGEYLDLIKEVRPDIITLPNPSIVSISGVRICIYHGRSLNAISKHVPGLQPVRPETVVESMRWMLRLRHLAPIYGEHPVAPERNDWLLLDIVPHVLHTGHIHVYGVGEYKGVRLINSGTFENETPYIKSLGIEVTVGKVPVLDLRDLSVEIEDFSG